MTFKTFIPLILALVLGLVAAIAARQMLLKRDGAPAAGDQFVQVVVAKSNLAAGSAIRADDLTLGRIEARLEPGSVFNTIAELEGRVVQAPVFKGLPVMASQLAPKGMGGGLQALVPQGMRAITVEVDEIRGVGGFLVPGCYVDVISTVQGTSGGEMISRTVVQRVKVTAVGQRLTLTGEGEQREPIKSVTLIATPREAEAIELAAATGRPRLVLRSGGDDRIGNSEGISIADLRGRRDEPLAPVIAPISIPESVAQQPIEVVNPASTPKVRTIKIIRGGVESQLTLAMPALRPQSDGRMSSVSVEDD